MTEKYKSGHCTICTEFFSVLHWHHTVPQSRGGKDSLQIPLCGNCHTVLHANAVAVQASLRRGSKKKTVRQFWPNAEQEERAAPYLEILVKALMLPIAEGYTGQHPIQLTVDTETYELIKLLQSDLGVSSIVKTIVHSIKYTLSERGLGNVATSRKAGQESKLWFMRRP